jgi:hypothetical protein
VARKADPVEERTLPHSIEAERSVLGAILISHDAITVVRKVLNSNDFYREAHRIIVRAMDRVSRAGVAIDLVTLKDELTKAGELDEVGGPAYISALTDGVPKSLNVEHYADIIRSKASLRAIILTANAAVAKAYEDRESPDEIRKGTIQTLSTLAAAGAKTRTREFTALGEQRYALRIEPFGITFDVDRLRRERGELVGELQVKVNGSFPMARTVDGVLSMADFNLSGARSRSERAKLLSERSQQSDLDWYGFLEEFCLKVLSTEREGSPASVLADVALEKAEDTSSWIVKGLPILQHLPMILHGDGGSGKSYISMLIAGTLADKGFNVLYADWEFDVVEHRRRLGRLFNPMPKGVIYVRCDKSMKDEADRLRRLVRLHEIQYFIGDSIAFACDSRPEEAEQAGIYFRALRELGVGSLNIAHMNKRDAEPGAGNDGRPFGSIFWYNGARSIWSVQAAEDNPPGELRIGLYHRKSNTGSKLAPRAYTIHFEAHKTWFEESKVADVDELAAKLPILERLRRVLAKGPLEMKQAADALGVTMPVLRVTLTRHAKSFVKQGNKIALLSNATEF